jgi:uncharacterized protein (DUF2267 family)
LATNITSLDRAVQNAVLWLNDIQAELGWEDRDVIYKATKAVLQTIRDRLPYEELFHLSSNLPMVFKGMLFDGYDTAESKKEKVKTVTDFYEQIQTHYDPTDRDIISGQQATFGVINVLFNRIGEGEMRKVADNMPLKLKPLFEHRVIPYTEDALTEISSAASS